MHGITLVAVVRRHLFPLVTLLIVVCACHKSGIEYIKCPGVCPIGVGEVCRRIVGKVVMMYSKHDLRQAVGPLQLCGGFESGCEAAFHAMSEIFQEDDTEAMLFVDATNAFNNLNRL